MSASDKKKIRKEQDTLVLTERQRAEQAEAKKLKIYTISFVTAMVLIVCVTLAVLIVRGVTNAGISERMTIAGTVGEEELNTIEFSYYYHDAINEYYNEKYEIYQDETDSYLLAEGLDTTKPLNEQYADEEKTQTWDQFFIERALEDAKRDIILNNEAKANSFELDEEQQASVDNVVSNIEMFAPYYGYANADGYMRAIYGNGASLKSYRNYYERTIIADSYYDAHQADYSYTDEQMRAYEAEDDKAINYTAFTYTSVYLSYTYFQQGGTEDENGTVTYSAEEDDAARAAMKAAAEDLITATTDEELQEKVDALTLKEGSKAGVSQNKNMRYVNFSGANADLTKWVIDENRKDGDIDLIPVTTDDGKTNGYYVLLFHSRNENTEPMGNVRHLLVKFEGGTEDEETGDVTYSDEEKAAAYEIAEGYLKTWQDGAKTEESFIELVKEHSQDEGSAAEGGLYEDINPESSYVENFLNWSIDPDRKEGDTEIVETEYGYHIMYYVGDSELSYRDHLITNEMSAIDQEAWYNELSEPVTAAVGDTSKLPLDLIIGQNG